MYGTDQKWGYKISILGKNKMPFIIDVDKVKTGDKNSNTYTNQWGAQCAALVQLAPLKSGGLNHVPSTRSWKQGVKVQDVTASGTIEKGTVIATFDSNGKYPSTDRHAAIYLSHDKDGITVLDQWASKPYASQRVLKFKNGKNRNVNDGSYFWVVEIGQ